ALGCQRRLRDHELNGCSRGHHAGDLRVEISLSLIAVQAWIGSIQDDVRGAEVGRKTKQCPKVSNVLWVDVGVSNQSNCNTGTIERSRRQQVINLGKVCGTDDIA